MTTTSLLAPGRAAASATAADRLAALPAGVKLKLVLGAVLVGAAALALQYWSREGDYKLLYANLSAKDGGAVLEQLSQMNIPYRHADGGNAILVPAGKVHDVRLKLASAGLPKGSTTGFEIMDGARFGQSQFQERLGFQRGLEGELTRSIASLAAVESARVHLALPMQNGFFREQQKPSASVVLTLYPGRTLERSQIAGIARLVASSVPELTPGAVSVLDQTGMLLNDDGDTRASAGLDARQLHYVAQVENNYQKRLVDLLAPLVGRDGLRAQVTADIDFSQSESTSEQFTPNQGPEARAAVRSQQSSEALGAAAAALPAGVPGAMSNQPPMVATAPLSVAPGIAPTAPASPTAAAGPGRRDSVTNYEVDKTVKVTRAASGSIRRISAAVVVNHRSATDDKGKTTQLPLAAEELEKLTLLAQEAIGFNKERGDTLKLVNAPFTTEPVLEPQTLPLWKQPELLDWLRGVGVPAALGVLGLAVFFGVLRPAVKAALRPALLPPGQLLAIADESPALALPLDQGGAVAQRLDARQLAKQNPAAAAAVVRQWVGSGNA